MAIAAGSQKKISRRCKYIHNINIDRLLHIDLPPNSKHYQGAGWKYSNQVSKLKAERVEWHDWSLFIKQYVHFMIAVKIFYCYSVHSPSSHTYHFRMQGFQSYSMMRSGWLLPRWINRSRKMEGIWAPLATRSDLQQRMSKTRQDCNISINNINCLVYPCLALSPGSSQLLTVTLKAGRSLGMKPTHI